MLLAMGLAMALSATLSLIALKLDKFPLTPRALTTTAVTDALMVVMMSLILTLYWQECQRL